MSLCVISAEKPSAFGFVTSQMDLNNPVYPSRKPAADWKLQVQEAGAMSSQQCRLL